MTVVTVGCKLPNGIHLDLDGKRVTLKGSNSSDIIGGHGITENVDEAFFNEWIKRNKHLEMVKHDHIFAHDKRQNTEAHAKADQSPDTGLEKIDPANLPGGIEMTDEQKRELAKKTPKARRTP